LQNYRGNPPLSDEGFVLLQKLVVSSAHNLQAFYSDRAAALSGPKGILSALLTLTGFTLEELASDSAAQRLATEMEWAEKIIDHALPERSMMLQGSDAAS
jgi:hypothetical protein